jgi:polyvinyl alcohol dehydrogenase (cytochrome)
MENMINSIRLVARRNTSRALWSGLMVIAMVAMFAASASAASWTSAGNGATDDRYQPDETTINTSNVGQLKTKWVFTTHGDVSATPTVSDGVVYFPDWGGYINAVDASTGKLIWQETVQSLEPANAPAGAFSRVSPVLDGNELIFGDNFSAEHASGAHLFAVNKNTGALLWSTQLDSHPAAIVTGSPVIVAGKLLIGTSSDEETYAENASYPCCTFRGSLSELDPATGAVIWKTYTVPSNGGVPCTSDSPPTGCGYSGGAVWDTPAVSVANNAVYIGTGNNYTTPDSASACEQAAFAAGTSDANCTSPDDHFDSVMALNFTTGAIIWSQREEDWDAWTIGCVDGTEGVNWCPDPEGPDWDFGSGPNLVTVPTAGGGSELEVGAGQKSGLYWMYDALTGKELWSADLGPGSPLGGEAWGTASDGTRIYVHESDAYHAPYTLPDGTHLEGGSWAALDPVTGAIDWQVPTPWGAAALGPQSVANGVVYTGSTNPFKRLSNMFALSAATGRILWRFPSGGSVNSGPAIVDGTVYWGSGYSEGRIIGYTGNDKLYAFSLGGT